MDSVSLNRTELSAAVGDAGWRLILGDLCTQVAATSLRQAAETAAALAALDSAAQPAIPDGRGQLRLDVRPDRLVITLAGVLKGGQASPAGADAARRLSARLRELGLTPEPAQAQTTEIAIDALDIPAVLPFWRAVFGYADESSDTVADPAGQGPAVWFQQMDAPRPQRNRIHIDIAVPHDQAQARLEAALAAGGKVVRDAEAPAFWVLADPEGNEAASAPGKPATDVCLPRAGAHARAHIGYCRLKMRITKICVSRNKCVSMLSMDHGIAANGECPGHSPGLRERKKAETREAIARAAVRLALERGPENVRVADVAAAADVSPRTYNNYFASIPEAICALLSDRELGLADAVRGRPADEPLDEAVANAIMLDTPCNDSFARSFTRMIVHDPVLRGEYYKAIVARDAALARVIAERTGTSPDDLYPQVLTAATSGAVRVAAQRWLHDDNADLGELLRCVLAMVAPMGRATRDPGSPAQAQNRSP